MKKGYLFVRPCAFSRLGDIYIDGEYGCVRCDDFNVIDPKENFLIFEVRFDECEDGRFYLKYCKEKVTGEPFIIQVQDRYSKRAQKKLPTAIIYSERLGLTSDIMALEDIEDKSSRVSGLFYHFVENPENKEVYCNELKSMIELARRKKWIYDHSVDGPSRLLSREMRRTYRRSYINFDTEE